MHFHMQIEVRGQAFLFYSYLLVCATVKWCRPQSGWTDIPQRWGEQTCSYSCMCETKDAQFRKRACTQYAFKCGTTHKRSATRTAHAESLYLWLMSVAGRG